MPMLFCPQCGHRLTLGHADGRERPLCDQGGGGCGYIDYGRYSLGAGGLVLREVDGRRKLLLVQRNHDPGRGVWTIPGGFVEWDETVEAAVLREVLEETSLRCAVVGLAGFRNRVGPATNDGYAVFLLKLVEDAEPYPANPEVSAAAFFDLAEMDRLERLAPLSRTLAAAALADRLLILPGIPVSSSQTTQPAILFMGDAFPQA